MEENQKKKENNNGCSGCLGCFGIIFLILLLIGGCSAIFTDGNSNDDTDKVTEEKNKPKEAVDKDKTDDSKESNKKEETKQSKSQNISNEKSNNKDKKEMKPGTKDRIPVELISTVDGDTAKFNYDGRTESFRFLLIDTPETKHPRVGKQPFGQEASDRTAELLTNAEKIEVEFDVGQKEDKYNRKLAYIYVDEEMLNNILVREGLAKVAYAYPPNTRYLDTLETSQEQAKSEKIGIWSIDSVFEKKQKDVYDSNENEDITTENQVDNPSSDVGQSEDSEQSTSNTESFHNCTALREVHPNGVPAGHAAYASKLDRDNDNYACEIN